MNPSPVPIIFDTDLETDCDDVGALCLLHNLQSAGYCRVEAIIADAYSDYIAPAASVINSWYGRTATPVGALRIPDYDKNPVYERYRRQIDMFENRFPGRLYNRGLILGTDFEGKTATDFAGTTEVYRRILSGAADGSVVVCVVGFMTALAQLLESEPDEISDLSGYELVARKASRVVAMAVIHPCPGKGDGNFNFQMDLPSAMKVVKDLPVPLYMSSWGTSITTGERFMGQTPSAHPGRRAYELYLRDNRLTPPEWNRSSWDQVAALFAVFGEGDRFLVKRGYTLTVAGEGFEWLNSAGGREDGYVIPVHEKRLEREIEDLMIGPPAPASRKPVLL